MKRVIAPLALVGFLGAAQVQAQGIYRAAVVGSVMIGLILQIGLSTYGGGQGLSWRVLVLDSVVNLGTIALAGVAGAWLLYQ